MSQRVIPSRGNKMSIQQVAPAPRNTAPPHGPHLNDWVAHDPRNSAWKWLVLFAGAVVIMVAVIGTVGKLVTSYYM